MTRHLRSLLLAAGLTLGSVAATTAVSTATPTVAAAATCVGQVVGRNSVFVWQQHYLYVRNYTYGNVVTVPVSYWTWFNTRNGSSYSYSCGSGGGGW